MFTIPEALSDALRYQQAGDFLRAEQLYRQILQADPGHVKAWHFLGILAFWGGRNDLAVEYISQALRFKPDYADAHNNLGLALKNQGRLDEAVSSFRYAIELKSNFPEAYSNLGHALQRQWRLGEAVECFRQALRLMPDFADAHNNLGIALREQGHMDEALAGFQEAVRLKPTIAEAHNNLGGVLKDMGLLDEALAAYRHAVELRPNSAQFHSNVLYTLHFHQDSNPALLAEEHRQWQLRHAQPLIQFIQPHSNDRNPERRLRVGYVSPDFRHHAESFFTVPLLASHDHEKFEIFCYADVPYPDEVTNRLRGYADAWRSIMGLTDEQAFACIHRDQIDILVDLTMHMANNRLTLFARKPAPVQVTWLAYQGTTGLKMMDYRLTDPNIDPPGLDDHYYSEGSVRLANSFWCYDPGACQASVNPLPALRRGHVTFGSFNNFCKVNSRVLALWAQVLHEVDGSRLVMLAAPGSPRRRTLDELAQAGVTPDRVDFVPLGPRQQYLEYYHQIDIGLDTFPYNGQTTTLDAWWMGVPVVTIGGDMAVARSGMSLARNLGSPQWIAESSADFVGIAKSLASDLPTLSTLRMSLRDRLRHSPLMDTRGFAGNVESAFRAMWRRWCQAPAARSSPAVGSNDGLS